ncbi:MAG TPA: ABC transporter substrate-binding protein, partial [Hyphomicrobiaceae bacterium]|nr:ABC transporter substrate-binding protein [Hyphomicrobiaceae bacterium]
MTQRAMRAGLVALAFLLMFAPAPSRAQNKEVLVGGAISLTGRFAEPAGRQVNAIKMWVEEVNGRGGLLGHKINLV